MTSRRRRAFGQHFLRDGNVIDGTVSRFLKLLEKEKDASVLEIGPGKGALTLPLLARVGDRSVHLVEKDPKLAAEWGERLPNVHASSRVTEADFLELPDAAWLPPAGGKLAVLSNLPYSVGTAILARLSSHADRIPFMVLMFQEEVAHRVRAEPSTPDRGSLSLFIQNRWIASKLLRVPPTAFAPPPAVFSEVVLLQARDRPMIEATSGRETLWEQCLSLAFRHRRKMLRSGALGTLPHGAEAIRKSGVDPAKRAESLGWEEWGKLFEAYVDALGAGGAAGPSSGGRAREHR